jgi:hypothetical protein
MPGRIAQTGGPALAHEVVVSADTAGGDDHGLGRKRERSYDCTFARHAPALPCLTDATTPARGMMRLGRTRRRHLIRLDSPPVLV